MQKVEILCLRVHKLLTNSFPLPSHSSAPPQAVSSSLSMDMDMDTSQLVHWYSILIIFLFRVIYDLRM